MGNDGASTSFSTLYGALSSQSFDRSGLTAVWHFCNEARLAAQRSTLSDVATYLRSLYYNDSVNRGQVVFLTTLVVAMAGCGLLSRLVRRRRSDKTRSSRFLIRKITSKSSTKTLTSSSDDDYEDDEYDSNGSLRHVTNPEQKAPEWSVQSQQQSSDAFKSDPGLLKKFTTYNSYTTSVATYPAIRTFFCPHPNQSRLPTKPTPLPLLVVVHGLGGSLAQFHHLLKSLSNVGSCFGIDLPGCGLSKFAPTEWDAYKVEALAELLAVAIERHRDQENGQEVILVGHSLGCSLSALLASSTSSIGKSLKPHIRGLIAICPRADPPSAHEVTTFRRLLHIPGPIFDLWRLWDRRGGIESASVMRMVGNNADAETRDLQVRFNKQSQTPVWRRMAWGTLPTYNGNEPVGGMPGEKVWAGINMPILMVAGEADAVTKPAEIQKLLKFFGDSSVPTTIDTDGSSVIPDASRVCDQMSTSSNLLAHDEKYGIKPTNEEKQINEVNLSSTGRRRLVKSAILPAPASHALLYDRATYRTLAGIIQDFLLHHIDKRLALGWQLQYMNTSGKWDVKNLAKWQKVAPVSEPIANTFAALKMLREVDEQHNPVLFSQKYRDRIYAVIDISHESPVYNPATMEAGGIHYCKHPTVSKIPPTPDETRDFIDLVDRLQGEIDVKMEKREDHSQPRPLVGVHCHYGYNRTGFLIVCYLIERRGFGVQDAIDEFNQRRAPGIRHEHFIDTLFVRYCVGLKRAPTL
ncbi:hypothetical protein N7448_003168 [Penicillium atrosanguineum]|uniref:Tyrosine specific protein phosphatases domain-containing protein n=1 Tax=Penicillium atrosanguineum TaxID=1132637 RepID=A0A9W9PXC5_9EURO|nr:hypothetical protein N7526_008975 [Penicillium atrosanguineum]KAJ5139760.1 hypothetical protein N7448_003168 [Penicillium atrosanguineum]KAJ5315204.1 hypothetical protein N7476_005511 [Penicillium atrosanguineum]